MREATSATAASATYTAAPATTATATTATNASATSAGGSFVAAAVVAGTPAVGGRGVCCAATATAAVRRCRVCAAVIAAPFDGAGSSATATARGRGRGVVAGVAGCGGGFEIAACSTAGRSSAGSGTTLVVLQLCEFSGQSLKRLTLLARLRTGSSSGRNR